MYNRDPDIHIYFSKVLLIHKRITIQTTNAKDIANEGHIRYHRELWGSLDKIQKNAIPLETHI